MSRYRQVDPVQPFSRAARSRFNPDLEKRRRAPQRRPRSGYQCALSKVVEDDFGVSGAGVGGPRHPLSIRKGPAGNMQTELTRDIIEQAFDDMGTLAAARGITIEIAVYGGSFLILASDIRNASGDVDAVFLAGALTGSMTG